MTKIYLLIPVLIFSFLNTSFAQEEDENCLEPKKKVLKYIIAAVNAKDARTAVENFNNAIEADPGNATAYYEYGMYAYNKALDYYETQPNPKLGDKSFEKAEEMFAAALERCPDYHANCSYYLGVINYTQKDMPVAIKWFKEFLNYKNSDTERYPEDYAKKLNDVKEVLGDLEQEQEVKTKEVPFNPVIVKNVSSSEEEYFPMISPDNELIFYTRKMDVADIGSIRSDIREMFTVSQRRSIKDDFDGGEPLKNPFNDGSVRSYGAATVSVDNKEMIICACKKEIVYDQPYMNCDLYRTTYERTGTGKSSFNWSDLENLGQAINTPDGWEGQPSLSADGNTLYYAVNRPTSKDNDIYVSKRKEDGTWGTAVPFDVVNTPGKDKSPFLHQDSETLYFVSECTKDRPGVGGLDIFYIRQKPDGSWTEPTNIGYPINSNNDELGLFVSIDGELAYFSSRVRGNWNIYSFELYEEARPQPVAILKGELKNDEGEPVSDAKIEIAYEGSDEVTEVKVNGDDGKYAAIVKTKKKQDVMVTVKKEGYAFDSKLITKESFKDDEVKIDNNDLAVKELKVGEAYTINDILYGTNSYVLSSKSKFILKGFARFLNENPTIKVSIHGHTDDVGDDTQNLKLSEDRAEGVKKYLVSLGVDKSRLSAKGFGETSPKVPNDSAVNRAKNRRTDFVIESL
jgi:outer membrane protein OmpA-like peptidoglycan-associated protein/tetratricopeptide (TPR) repeat protein